MTMTRGLLIYRDVDLARNRFFATALTSAAEKENLSLDLVTTSQLNISLRTTNYSFAIIRSRMPLLNETLEMLGIACYNPSLIARLGNDKALLAAYANRHNIPSLPSWLLGQEARIDTLDLPDPVVLKPLDGFGGDGVRKTTLAETPSQLRKASRLQLAQPLWGDYGSDVRAYVLSGKVIAWIRRRNEANFRSNLGQGGIAEVATPSPSQSSLVQQTLDNLPKGFFSIDILTLGDDAVLNEIEDVVGSRALYKLNICDPAAALLRSIRESLEVDAKPTTSPISNI